MKKTKEEPLYVVFSCEFSHFERNISILLKPSGRYDLDSFAQGYREATQIIKDCNGCPTIVERECNISKLAREQI